MDFSTIDGMRDVTTDLPGATPSWLGPFTAEALGHDVERIGTAPVVPEPFCDGPFPTTLKRWVGYLML
ncbi:hypothetical protein PH30N_00960 [Cutibacterium modestum 30N]|nr:hypothetical protein BCB70_00020 [Cutibacterium modestum]EFT15652.1 hypothetical protein HMPREF9622_01269 [Cutibacterium modestum HL037PA3]MCP2375515.1 hypothetical protein [Cutibacterium modestum 28N]MCP2379665.1 hypothetical protein [Cutibacterium modestum 30N]REB75176.1 hypothetical protein CP877_05135 [Cutibacterium modestum]